MQAKAILRNYRMSPQKVRLVVDVVRGKPVDLSLSILRNMPHKAALPVAKLIASAAANAENNFKMTREGLFVKTIFTDEGPVSKRSVARARGRGNVIRKRTSHITVVVDDGEEY
ncbi:MAG: 50S ribosomal protein L22 [Herpetosiphon sp.]